MFSYGTVYILFTYCLHNVAEFKEFEPRLKYSWFHLKLNLMFQDLNRRSIETGFWRIETRLKFIKFGLCLTKSFFKTFKCLPQV